MPFPTFLTELRPLEMLLPTDRAALIPLRTPLPMKELLTADPTDLPADFMPLPTAFAPRLMPEPTDLAAFTAPRPTAAAPRPKARAVRLIPDPTD